MSQDNIQSQVHKNLIFKYLWKSWKRTQNQTACETANRMEVGGGAKGKCMTNPHEVSQTAFVCTEMVLWDSLQKKEQKN